MTEAGWTQEPPKLPGWYWWRHSHLARVHITRVNDRLEVVALNELFNVSDSDHVDECDGQWLGPITPDSYQQGRVDGLRECLDMLEGEIARDRDSGVLESLRQRMEAKLEECK